MDDDFDSTIVELAQADPQWIAWDRSRLEARPFQIGEQPLVSFAGPGGHAVGLFWREA